LKQKLPFWTFTKYSLCGLPQDPGELEKVARKLSVSLEGVYETSDHPHLKEYELQRRILEAIQHRRDSWRWLIWLIGLIPVAIKRSTAARDIRSSAIKATKKTMAPMSFSAIPES